MPILLCSAAPLCAAPSEGVDAGWILQRIARPAPASTGFVELRGSALLKTPLRVEGRYARPDADTLVREVSAPYRETTTLRGGQATLERQGKPPRRFALDKVPELAALQDSFGAILSGDRRLLEQHYVLAAEGSRQQWRMQLKPKDAALAQRLREVRLFGRGAELRCIESEPAKGDMQRTLLAGAAEQAQQVADADALAALCHGQRQ
ncbi:fatty acyl CoA synthetase [Stenotrophomonas sp. MMGLT7]|nr:LolA-related protein [Stenotrophomonas sp. MMGLT7]MCD7099862.1 fatty acyl CoA synthetase [Stenotrophomonas sp. MMGLT7]